MTAVLDLGAWERRFEDFLDPRSAAADAAHDLAHVRRVVAMARSLGRAEGARPEVVVPAAWLHDCVVEPKDSQRRSMASSMAADAAATFLEGAGYPIDLIGEVRHAVEAHSFSANVAPETLEAKVVQDADRLDALGAIGIARCLMVGGALGLPFYHPAEPFPEARAADDTAWVLDHFYVKLLKLPDTMQTRAGRAEARRRARFTGAFLRQLRAEIGPVRLDPAPRSAPGSPPADPGGASRGR